MILWTLFHPAGERVYAVPSSAMAPTLVLRDYAAVTPYADGSRPARGDIIAFLGPEDAESIHFFRVIGLPGETVRMVAGFVTIDGTMVRRKSVGEIEVDLGYETLRGEAFRETLPGGARYEVVETETDGLLDDTDDFVVPAGHYFVLGDNRDNAADSRNRTGYVPHETIIGRIDRTLCSPKPDSGGHGGDQGKKAAPVS